MRVLPCMLLLALLSTTATGCSLFKKNTNGAQGLGGGPAPAKFPGAKDPLMPATPPPQFPGAKANVNDNSILAGTVVDGFHRPMSNAYIRWVNLTDKDAGAPIDVAADAQGHFIIQGVKPGGSYKLIARTKQGDRLLAGTVLTSAPNVRVLIPIREDLVTADTPPMPGAPAVQGKPAPAQGESRNTNPAPKGPIETPVLSVPAAPSDPVPVTRVPNAGNPGTPSFVPGVVETPFKDRLPMLTVPNKNQPVVPPVAPGGGKLDTGPTRVPSCVLVGNHLENLALKDSKGQTWEYKKQGAGKIVLIDFWYKECMPCRETMPLLNRLHTQYGTRGLEVIGIAQESAKDERRDAEAVNKACAAMQVTYRQLMGRSAGFDAAKQFKVEAYPTLLLLGENGDIIYHHVGRPDAYELGTLERIIQSRLRAY